MKREAITELNLLLEEASKPGYPQGEPLLISDTEGSRQHCTPEPC